MFVLLVGCASSHDLKRDGINFFGGGYLDEKAAPGFFLVKAFSNSLMVSTSDAAARTFSNRATELCPKGYVEIRTLADSYKDRTQRVNSKIGHVLCNDSPLTAGEARTLLEPQAN